MYEAFFGFRERPFDLTPNSKYLVLTESHREALSNLEYGIASRKGITLLIGEAGAGKTTVIHAAIERQPGRVHCVNLQNPTLSRDEFVEMLAARFNLSERAAQSKTAMLLELEALLLRRHQHGETTVLVIDEAQSLPLELLEEIRLLANIESEAGKLLSVIIAGQPELVTRLNDQNLRQLKQRVALRCELRALSLQETMTYVAGRIRAAGGVAAHVFTRDAVAMIHEKALGLPRTISVIADNSLLGGFAAGQKPVGVAIVRDVCRDFDIGSSRGSGLGHAPEPLGPAAPPATGQFFVEAPPRAAAVAPRAKPGQLKEPVEPAEPVEPVEPSRGPKRESASAETKPAQKTRLSPLGLRPRQLRESNGSDTWKRFVPFLN